MPSRTGDACARGRRVADVRCGSRDRARPRAFRVGIGCARTPARVRSGRESRWEDSLRTRVVATAALVVVLPVERPVRPLIGVQPGLEQHHGGRTVDHLARRLARPPRRGQRALGLHGGEALVGRLDAAERLEQLTQRRRLVRADWAAGPTGPKG